MRRPVLSEVEGSRADLPRHSSNETSDNFPPDAGLLMTQRVFPSLRAGKFGGKFLLTTEPNRNPHRHIEYYQFRHLEFFSSSTVSYYLKTRQQTY